MGAGDWSWLEVAKLSSSLLTPTALAIAGIFIHRITKRFEDLQWRSQKLVEKRLAIYDDLAPQFNDLLCYFSYVGGWRDLNPPSVVALKRAIDKKIFVAAPLFSREFFSACQNFQSLCFTTYNEWGKDASLRSHFDRRKQHHPGWKEEWDYCFSSEISDPKDVRAGYERVMEAFARDIGVNSAFSIPSSGRIPGGIIARVD
jgi:hypothetical protein